MTTSLRIAIVLNPFTLRRKGGEHAPAIAAELLGRGHSVRAFGDVARGVPQSRSSEGLGDPVAPLDGASLGAFEPDVIVAYDALSPAAWRGARAASKLGVPLVLVEEGFPDHGKPIERLARGFGARAWGRLVRRQARRVIALDPAASRQARDEGFGDASIVELASGVDTTTFRPGLQSAILGSRRIGAHVLLFIGRIEPRRGLDTLVDAFARTVGTHSDWSLALAGTGSARHAIRAQVERLGVSAHVHWLGVPREAELPGLLGSSTALVVPAIDDDVASLKIRRAMACGVPVLASDVPRLRGVVQPDRTGLTVPPGERVAWEEAILRLASDPNRRARWGRTAREVALETLSWERVADRVEELLLDVVSTERDSGAAAASSRPVGGPTAGPPGDPAGDPAGDRAGDPASGADAAGSATDGTPAGGDAADPVSRRSPDAAPPSGTACPGRTA